MAKKTNKNNKNVVLVRCRNAGVHVGEFVSRNSHILILENSRRIWRWRGANTCSDLALSGCDTADEYTRISPALKQITFTCADVCEVIPMTETAARIIMEAKPWQ